MKHLSYEEFATQFPPREDHVGLIGWPGDFTVERNTAITGTINGDVTVTSGAQAIITGVVKGCLVVQPDAEVYLTGVVEGDVKLEGSACMTGRIKGVFQGGSGAYLCSNARFGPD